MMTDDELTEYYVSMAPIFSKALEDVAWDLEQFIRNVPDEDVKRHFISARISKRVKTLESFLRKCRREQVENAGQIATKVEDLLGLRIATANKTGASALFEHFQHNAKPNKWFCGIKSEVKFVPYTIEAKNNYSLRSGYQAYHLTFVHERKYQVANNIDEWPIEIQIMSRLWEFWAEYSREYFYGNEASAAAEYLPYNMVISKILDSADDLMVATSDRILQEVTEVANEGTNGAEEQPNNETEFLQDVGYGSVSLNELREWFEQNSSEFFGNARIPGNFFLSRILDDLYTYKVAIEQLTHVLRDKSVDTKYMGMLNRSSLKYLPPHEQILTKILLYLEKDEKSIISEVNQGLRRLGIALYPSTFP